MGRLLALRVRCVRCVDQNGLDGARRDGAHHTLALFLVGPWVVGERLLTVHGEDVRREKRALRVSLAFVEIDDKPHQ